MRFCTTGVAGVLWIMCASSVAFAADPQPSLIGKWHNKLCSEMEIKTVDAATGLLGGEYRTGVGQPGPADVYRLTGFINGDLIGFVVNWGKPVNAGGKVSDSVTSWSGQHTTVGGKDLIKTFWQLAVNVKDADEMEELWAGMWTGGDNFEKGSVPAGCKPQP